MRINVAIPEPYVKAPILDAALEGVTRLNEALLREGSVPIFAKVKDRVRWRPEPPGQEHFDHAAKVMSRGWGDCDDLAPWHAASLRVTGKDPGARAVVKRSGQKRWHAIVKRSDGRIEDPSLAAGMPGPGGSAASGINGAVLPTMFAPTVSGVDGTYIARPQLAIRPLRDRQGQVEAWQARADLPWHWQPRGDSPGDIAMASLHRSPVSSQAIVGACRGAIKLGMASGYMHEDHLDRVGAIADMCEGASWEEVADEYGPDHATAAGALVNGFFGGLRRAASKLVKPAVTMAAAPFGGMGTIRRVMPFAMPLAQKALPFVPGVGPAAALALQYASPMLQQAIQERAHEPPPMRAEPPGTPFYAPDQYQGGGGFDFDPRMAAQFFQATPFR